MFIPAKEPQQRYFGCSYGEPCTVSRLQQSHERLAGAPRHPCCPILPQLHYHRPGQITSPRMDSPSPLTSYVPRTHVSR